MLQSVDNLSPMSSPLPSAMPWKSKTIFPCSSNSSKETAGFCILLSSLGSHLHSNFGHSLGRSYFSQQLIVKEVVFLKLFSVEDSVRYLVHYVIRNQRYSPILDMEFNFLNCVLTKI